MIYKVEENGKQLYDFRKLLDDYYKPLLENYLLKNNNKNINNKNNKEKIDVGSEKELAISSFNSFLFDLKSKIHLTPTQLKFNETDFFHTTEYYDLETVKKYALQYLNEFPRNKIADFLKHDNFAKDKNLYIENKKREEEEDLNNIIKNLQELFNDRRKMHTDDKSSKRGKSNTTFVVNNRSKDKLKQALEIFGEIGVKNAFIAYCDAVIKEIETPEKFMPYFLASPEGEFGVIEQYLDYFNINYGYSK